jgi:PAS domain S-box-containing protein
MQKAASDVPAGSAQIVSLALRRALQSWDGLLENLPVGIYTCDREGLLVQFNRRAAELWGRSPTPGDPRYRYCGTYRAYSPDGEPLALADTPMSEALRTGQPVRDREVMIERPDGARLAILANVEPLFDDNGELVGAVNCFQDISERRRIEGQLRESERRFRELIEALPAAIYTTDAEGRITYYNEAAAEFWGHRPELNSSRWCGSWKLFYPDGRPMPHDECPMAVALRENRLIRGEEAIAERPDGTRVPFEPYPTPVRDASGALVGAVNMLMDLSERKQAAQLERRLAAIVESSDDAILSKDLDGIIRTWNRAAERLFGYQSGEVIGKPVTILIPLDRQDEEPRILARIRKGERVDHYDTIRRRKDGSLVEIELTVSPVRNDNGQIVGASKIARDITERRRAEARQKLLIDELNHRVKNTLATVQSLATQTAQGARSPQAYRERLEGRLIALSRAHDQLSHRSWAHADLAEIVAAGLAPYRQSEADDNVTIAGEPIRLTPRAAVTLAMVFHELATNAVKYGALSQPAGRLAIAWTTEAGPRRRLRLSWRESGGPRVSPPARRGFGTLLVERGIATDLGGVARLEFAPSGVRCEIDVPIDTPAVNSF